MGAIKGVGADAVAAIVEEEKDGKYKSILTLTKRIDLRAANKKKAAGWFDSFWEQLKIYFHDDGDGITLKKKAMAQNSRE
jgi:DNA polymerase-3 subunit alpha